MNRGILTWIFFFFDRNLRHLNRLLLRPRHYPSQYCQLSLLVCQQLPNPLRDQASVVPARLLRLGLSLSLRALQLPQYLLHRALLFLRLQLPTNSLKYHQSRFISQLCRGALARLYHKLLTPLLTNLRRYRTRMRRLSQPHIRHIRQVVCTYRLRRCTTLTRLVQLRSSASARRQMQQSPRIFVNSFIVTTRAMCFSSLLRHSISFHPFSKN